MVNDTHTRRRRLHKCTKFAEKKLEAYYKLKKKPSAIAEDLEQTSSESSRIGCSELSKAFARRA